MVFASRPPTPPLDSCIERLWLIRDAPAHAKERISASASVDLVINLHEDELRLYDSRHIDRCQRFSGALVTGTQRGPLVIDPRERVSVMGAHFRPGGVFALLGAPADALADQHVDLEALWGDSARQLREQLCAGRTPEERFNLLERALLQRLFRPPNRHPAVRWALAAFARPAGSIREVAREIGLSQRRFGELFAREVGMGPKLFCRIRRFRQALETIRSSKTPEWGRLAADSGYYDQSHMIHEFRDFSGLSPTEFIRLQSGCAMQNHASLVIP